MINSEKVPDQWHQFPVHANDVGIVISGIPSQLDDCSITANALLAVHSFHNAGDSDVLTLAGQVDAGTISTPLGRSQ